MPRVFYYAPDHNVPSWGIGMLYTHVRLLRSGGIQAFVLHDRHPFRPRWLKMNVPRVYLNRLSFEPRPDDVLVVPEVVAGGNRRRPASNARLKKIKCRRLVFVQGSSLIQAGLRGAASYEELGYEGVIAVMPHVQSVLQTHFDTQSVVIPPSIACYFFADDLQRARRHQVVLCPKMGCEDYPLIAKLLGSRLPRFGWSLLEIKDKSHRQVARIMQESAFHVSVNCQESFNATVPEAMAAGCIPICYEAFGGRDFLKNGRNAFVFPNHHIYPLLERTLDLVKNYDRRPGQLGRMRRSAHATARGFSERHTQAALLRYFRPLLSV